MPYRATNAVQHHPPDLTRNLALAPPARRDTRIRRASGLPPDQRRELTCWLAYHCNKNAVGGYFVRPSSGRGDNPRACAALDGHGLCTRTASHLYLLPPGLPPASVWAAHSAHFVFSLSRFLFHFAALRRCPRGASAPQAYFTHTPYPFYRPRHLHAASYACRHAPRACRGHFIPHLLPSTTTAARGRRRAPAPATCAFRRISGLTLLSSPLSNRYTMMGASMAAFRHSAGLSLFSF